MFFNIGRVSGNNITRNIGEFDWLKHISDLQPTRELISETLGVTYGTDRDLHIREQVVFDFVERFVQNLNARQAITHRQGQSIIQDAQQRCVEKVSMMSLHFEPSPLITDTLSSVSFYSI